MARYLRIHGDADESEIAEALLSARVKLDDVEDAIPHAHVVVNNTNVETGRRLHVPDPKGLNRDLQQMARERGLGYLADKHHLYDKQAKGGPSLSSQSLLMTLPTSS